MTGDTQLALIPPPAEPTPVRPWVHRGEFRAWAREESAAAIALNEAHESGDAKLIEGARRAHREVVGRMPACALPRRRR